MNLEREDIEYLMAILHVEEQRCANASIPEPVMRLMNAAKQEMPINPTLSEQLSELERLANKNLSEIKMGARCAFRIRVKLDEMLQELERTELNKPK